MTADRTQKRNELIEQGLTFEQAERWLTAPLPVGVSYRPDVDNFYLDGTRAGMGTAFHTQWKFRCDEFPQLAASW